MSGYHAELFSYALNLELADAGANHNLAPLKLQAYQQVYMTELEPRVHLVFDRSKRRVSFFVESSKGQFRIHTSRAELAELPEVETALCGEATFVTEDEKLTRLVPRADIHQVLQQVAHSLTQLPNPS
jgi:predicted AAA+ superfamily ATPase